MCVELVLGEYRGALPGSAFAVQPERPRVRFLLTSGEWSTGGRCGFVRVQQEPPGHHSRRLLPKP